MFFAPSPHPPLMDRVCQLVSSHWALFDISPHRGSENLFAVSSSNSSCGRGEADPLQNTLPQLATKQPWMIAVLENSPSQYSNATCLFSVCWVGWGRMRAGIGTSRLLDLMHRHQDQQLVTEEEVCMMEAVQGCSSEVWALE